MCQSLFFIQHIRAYSKIKAFHSIIQNVIVEINVNSFNLDVLEEFNEMQTTTMNNIQKNVNK